jgi:hypothetical protein
MALGTAALLFGSLLACSDRSRQDVSSRAERAAEQAGAEVRQGAADAGTAAERAGEAIREGASDAAGAAENAAEKAKDETQVKREEFRRDVTERLDNLDEEISVLADNIGEDAEQARKDAFVKVREARDAVGRSAERLSAATGRDWEEAKREVSSRIDALVRRIRALQPDAEPMGGAGGPH